MSLNSEAQKRWKIRHPEEYRAANHKSYLKHKEKYRALHRKNRLEKYGLTAERFAALLVEQGGSCAICRKKFTDIPQVDHNHDTSRVRGLLCHTCNAGLGMFHDSRLLVQLADEYLASREGVR